MQYDKRVTVTCQPNAWCDDIIMKQWITNSWKPNIKEECLLVLDVQEGIVLKKLAQNEAMIARSFKKCGISEASDGSEDFKNNLKGIEDYQVDLNTDDNDENMDPDNSEEDPFAEISDSEASEGYSTQSES